jgi:hypothetical protein
VYCYEYVRRSCVQMTMRGYIHESRVNNWNKKLPLAFQT